MIYELEFTVEADKEWKKLDSSIKTQFKKKLIKIIENPHIPNNKLSGMPNCYKIKLRSAGYRLVYKVKDDVVIITVVAIGKRERNEVYKNAVKRLDD